MSSSLEYLRSLSTKNLSSSYFLFSFSTFCFTGHLISEQSFVHDLNLLPVLLLPSPTENTYYNPSVLSPSFPGSSHRGHFPPLRLGWTRVSVEFWVPSSPPFVTEHLVMTRHPDTPTCCSVNTPRRTSLPLTTDGRVGVPVNSVPLQWSRSGPSNPRP